MPSRVYLRPDELARLDTFADQPSPPPPPTPTDELATIGTNDHDQPVTLDRATRNRHLYLIGKSGTGKTTLMLNLMRADLEAGDGFTFIDPAGDAAFDLLGYVPSHRTDDVIFFDPTRDDCPALNLLALPYDTDTLAKAILSAIGLFFNISGDTAPRMRMLLRNGLVSLLDDRTFEPHSLADLEKLFLDDRYRATIAERITDNDRARRFLVEDLARYKRGDLDSVLNKLDAFLSTRRLARLFGTTTNALNFDAILNERKIFVCSLAKGKIGEDEAQFLGGLIVAALLATALARADQPAHTRADHFLYVDEFQNFAVESFATIFAEARKYRLNLTVAHQTRDQLTPEIRAAIGNASTYVVFRVSHPDAASLAPELKRDAFAYPDGRHFDAAAYTRDVARALRRCVITDPYTPAAIDPPANTPPLFLNQHLQHFKDTGDFLDPRTLFALTPAPWPTADHITNLDNLHAFARIERPQNTTALTVPFPPPPDEKNRAAVLTTQAEKNRPPQSPQEPRTAAETSKPLHHNSTTFDDDATEPVHSPHAATTTPRPPRRLPTPRRRA